MTNNYQLSLRSFDSLLPDEYSGWWAMDRGIHPAIGIVASGMLGMRGLVLAVIGGAYPGLQCAPVSLACSVERPGR